MKRKIITIFLIVLLIIINIWVLLFKKTDKTIYQTLLNKYKADTEYSRSVEVPGIGLEILENGKMVAYGTGSEHTYGTILNELIPSEGLIFGKKYIPNISIKNNGGINEYIRVIIQKFWADENGKIDNTLDSSLIKINISNNDDWLIDKEIGTSGRIVLYYRKPVKVSEETPKFIESIQIDPSVINKVNFKTEQAEDGSTIVTSNMLYNNKKVVIQIEASSVQEHNAVEAIYDEWRRKVEIDSNGILTLL